MNCKVGFASLAFGLLSYMRILKSYNLSILLIFCSKHRSRCCCHPDHGLIYNACQLELAGILMLENVNKLQLVEACLHF